ncbi:MAG TPA: AAA family ATPase [Candidatus Limnocylindrales bacterium]|nr:AAA family ATPase [Candidatus Limnocylindrales bacterium]
MTRPAVICALPPEEALPVVQELANAGFDVVRLGAAEELEAVLRTRRDVGLAIIDGESDFDASLEFYSILHDQGRHIPALMIVSPRTFERLSASTTSNNDEFFTRPYSAESLRWRVEAMIIRAQTFDDGSGEILRTPEGVGEWGKRALVVALFNPKGGVGKTTIATNLASALQVLRGQRVLLIDADPVSGHIATSLGLDRIQAVADAWDVDENTDVPTLPELAAAHPNGLRVVVLTTNPLQQHRVAPTAFVDGLAACRAGFDVVILDLHPDYGQLNQAIFERCDRILVPITPDLPAIRAALQFVELSQDLGVRDRIAMVVNRANSGVGVADMEKATGLRAFGQIRSGGLLFVRAANEGTTVVEKFPTEKVSADFEALADRVLLREVPINETDRGFLKLFSRVRETRPREVARA